MKNKCSIRGCKETVYGQGYCKRHYSSEIYNPRAIIKWVSPAKEGEKACSVSGCGISHYAHGFCRNHYNLFVKYGEPCKKHEIKFRDKPYCSVENCKEVTYGIRDNGNPYCKFHYGRYGKVDLNRGKGIKGELNPRWNGGTSEYPNHYEFKKNRLIRLDQVGWKCERCGSKLEKGYKTRVHHKDHNKANHSIDNLEAVCTKCHPKLHTNLGRPRLNKVKIKIAKCRVSYVLDNEYF